MFQRTTSVFTIISPYLQTFGIFAWVSQALSTCSLSTQFVKDWTFCRTTLHHIVSASETSRNLASSGFLILTNLTNIEGNCSECNLNDKKNRNSREFTYNFVKKERKMKHSLEQKFRIVEFIKESVCANPVHPHMLQHL